jgi:hypothetical protein
VSLNFMDKQIGEVHFPIWTQDKLAFFRHWGGLPTETSLPLSVIVLNPSFSDPRTRLHFPAVLSDYSSPLSSVSGKKPENCWINRLFQVISVLHADFLM